jgi:ATP-dependent Clp protease ATP-binding subunit ClpA
MEALELAGDDAFRLGQAEIRNENLLFGLLRSGHLPAAYFTKASHLDLDRFRADVADRIRPIEDRVERPKLLLDPGAKATIEAAIATATRKRRELVHALHLLHALAQAEDGVVANILARYGSSAADLNAKLEGAL